MEFRCGLRCDALAPKNLQGRPSSGIDIARDGSGDKSPAMIVILRVSGPALRSPSVLR
jgi:hypothetical protein